MKKRTLFAALALGLGLSTFGYSQTPVVIADYTKSIPETNMEAEDMDVFQTALPSVQRKLKSETCEGNIEYAGFVKGSFTRAGADQGLAFYQFCQTGNGLGWVGLVLMENGKVIGSYVADVGWALEIGLLPDINQNGLNEFTLAYSGGMHQGEGGIGVDMMEFASMRPKGIGWFQAEKLMDDEPTTVWKVTAKKGKVPVFYKQKMIKGSGDSWRRSGGNQIFKPEAIVAKFVTVK